MRRRIPHKSDNARNRQKRESDIDRLKRIRNIDRAGIGAKYVKKRILDDDGEPQSDQQHVAVVAM